MKIVVLDGYAVNPGDLSWDFLNKYGDVEIYDKTPDNECAEKCKDADVVFTNRAKINEDLLKVCKNIKYVSALGTGYDMIDINACKNRNIAVVNIPDYSASSVAQLTVQFLIALYSDLDGIQNIVRTGNWTGVPGYRYDKVNYVELFGKTIGLVGCGSIGKKVAAIAHALGMNVLAHTANAHEDTEIVRYVELNELLKNSDVVSLHCPLNDSTRNMVDDKFISKMKDGAKLINTSRGAVLDENAVANSLVCGKLSGAALDVLAVEPAVADNPLLKAPNCIITPHIAWASKAARERLLAVVDKSLDDFVRTGNGLNRIV